jgi:hypothetical protein
VTEQSGIDKARAARERQEQILEEVRAQRPEVRQIKEHAVRLRLENSYAELMMRATTRRTA